MKKSLSLLLIVVLSALFVSPSVLAEASMAEACQSYLDSLDSKWDTVTVGDVLKNLADYTVIDCREATEYAAGHIEGAINIPTKEIIKRINEIPTGKTIVIHCRTGIRSSYAHAALKLMGVEDVKNMLGGFNAWLQAKQPVVK